MSPPSSCPHPSACRSSSSRDGGLRSGLVEQIFKTAGGYPYVSVNAYNPWALAELDGVGIAKSGGWICDALISNPVAGGPQCETALQFGPVPAVIVGTALLLTAFFVICGVIARRPDPLTILVGVTLLAIAFFVLPTRVHERYLFPFFSLGAILAAISGRWLVAYVVLTVATFLNMYVVLTTIYPDVDRGIVDWLGIGQAVRSQARGVDHRPVHARHGGLGVPPDPARGDGQAEGRARQRGTRTSRILKSSTPSTMPRRGARHPPKARA